MLLYSQEHELRCIRTIVDPGIPEEVRSTLLGKVNQEFFHFEPCREAFDRINSIAKKRHELMEYADLIEDPALDEEVRDLFRTSKIKKVKSEKRIKRMVQSLSDYRKIRLIHDMCRGSLVELKGGKVRLEEMLDDMADGIARCRRDIGSEQTIMRIGAKHTAEDVVHNALHKVKSNMIKTGFHEYDSRNGGVPESGVMILGATTSGGKTATLMQLTKNMYEFEDRNVCRISLEMGEEQEMHRLLSSISGIPFWKFKQCKLSPSEKKKALKAYQKFQKHGKKKNCQYDTVCPTRGMTIEEALRMVKPYKYDVIGIDYVSLLEGVDEDNQWRVLGAIVREAKIFSRENDCLVIILAQIDDETNKLRYSKTMKEHADVMWSWNYSKPEQRELKVLPFDVGKARDGELFSFDMDERFDIMRVVNGAGSSAPMDVSDDDIDMTPTSKKSKKKSKKSKKKDDSLDDSDDAYALS